MKPMATERNPPAAMRSTMAAARRRRFFAPLDQRVGGERRAVDDRLQRARRDSGLARDDADAVEDSPFRRGVVGEHLGREQPAVDIEGDVREGAADIRAEAYVFRCAVHAPILLRAAGRERHPAR